MRTRVVGGRKAPGGSQAGRKRTQKGREERRKENFYIGFSRMGLRLRLRLPRPSWLPTFPAFGTRERRRPRVCVVERESLPWLLPDTLLSFRGAAHKEGMGEEEEEGKKNGRGIH